MDKDLYKKARMYPGFAELERDYQSLEKESVSDQQKFFQHALIVASSTFGILISFHDKAFQYQYTRWVFLLAIVLLSIGILSSSIALYAVSTLNVRLMRSSLKELDRVFDGKGYTPENVHAGSKILIRVFQICSICSYLLSIVLLTVYVVLEMLQY
jgi:hypothetical protein